MTLGKTQYAQTMDTQLSHETHTVSKTTLVSSLTDEY